MSIQRILLEEIHKPLSEGIQKPLSAKSRNYSLKDARNEFRNYSEYSLI